MVKGLSIFRDYFKEYAEQYVLIGGAACSLSFEDSGADFRATKDLDIVLIIEAQTKEFGQKFWQFIKDGKYINKARSDGKPQFYRFSKPQTLGYPAMLELFARSSLILDDTAMFTSIHIDDAVSSLSAILLDDSYYEALLDGRNVIEGVSVLKPTWLIPFKAKAWLELNKQAIHGEHVDSRNIKKHRNDILKMVFELELEQCELPEPVRADMKEFSARLHVTDDELKKLNIIGVHEADIKRVLTDIYKL